MYVGVIVTTAIPQKVVIYTTGDCHRDTGKKKILEKAAADGVKISQIYVQKVQKGGARRIWPPAL